MKCAIFFATAVFAAAQGPSTFRADTRVVEVPVFATGPGDKTVDDLRAEDLLLFDNNRPQTIATLEKFGENGKFGENEKFRETPGNAAAPVSRPRPDYSVILLDALNTDWANQIYSREAVIKTLNALPPGSHIAIFALGDTLHLLHDFSSDTPSLRASVDHYEGERPFWGADNPFWGAAGPVNPPVNPLSAQYSSDEIAHRAQTNPDSGAGLAQEQRIFNTFDALTEIARIMQKAPGRKNLLWISSAFALTKFHQDAARAMDVLNGAGLILYAIDPRGILTSFKAEANDDTMKELTEQTGGRTFYNNNEVASLLRAAFDDSRSGYLLTYAPRDYDEDGSHHDVRLKTTRKGVTLRYRPGYVADSR
jgi:VWFA-related protein